MNPEYIEPVCQAAIGGFFLSMFNLYMDIQKPISDRIPKDFYFILFFFFWPFAGAALAYIYLSSGYDIKGWLAFTTGLTTPTTIQTVIQKGNQTIASVTPSNNVEE